MDARALAPRASLALAALVACSGCSSCGGNAGTAPAGTAPAQPPTGPAPASAASPSAPVPALPGGGERAFVIDDHGLIEVSTAGGTQPIGFAGRWCAVDARANVVWFIAGDDLRAFDLADRRTRTIIDGGLEEAGFGGLEVIIDWGKQQLGGEDLIHFDVGVALQLSGKPTLEMVMGCEGDRMVYCYEEDLKTPKPGVVALQQRARKLRLADPAYVATLASRGKQGSLWSPPPAPSPEPKKKPTVDPERCTEHVVCGELRAVSGSPLWLVVTNSSRGDYYHETRELWDSATGEYIRPDGAKLLRSKTPPAYGNRDTNYAGLRVSPSGTFSHGGYVFDTAKVHYAPKNLDDGPVSCGWVSGGRRVPGPTDGLSGAGSD